VIPSNTNAAATASPLLNLFTQNLQWKTWPARPTWPVKARPKRRANGWRAVFRLFENESQPPRVASPDQFLSAPNKSPDVGHSILDAVDDIADRTRFVGDSRSGINHRSLKTQNSGPVFMIRSICRWPRG
jgi:hypothetical protein